MFSAIFRREWQIKCQSVADWLQPLVLMVLILTLFAIAVGGNATILVQIGVPVVITALMLCTSFGGGKLFFDDVDNGTVALLVAQNALWSWVWARVLLTWLFGAVLLILSSAIAIPLFGLDTRAFMALLLAMLSGSAMLVLLNAVAHALTLGVQNSGLLVPLIALPLQLPVLIFVAGAVDAALMGLGFMPILWLLVGLSALFLCLAPPLIAWLLKNAAAQ